MWNLVSIAIALIGTLAISMSRRFPDRRESVYLWCLALVSLPAGLTIGLRDSLEPSVLSALIVAIAALYWAISYHAHSSLTGRWGMVLAVVAGLLPLLAVYETRDGVIPLVLCLLVAVLINAELSLRTLKAWFALIALFAALLVPALVGQGVTAPAISAAAQAWAYVALAAFLVLWRLQLRGLGESFEAVGVLGYLLAVLTALAYALVSGPDTTLAVGLVLGLGLYRFSRWELFPEAFIYLATMISGYAFMQLSSINNWPISFDALILATYGSLLYLAGRRSESPRKANALRYSGLLLTFTGIYPGLLTSIPPLEPVVALAAGGILLWFEARWQRWSLIRELAIGIIMVLALDWLLRYEEFTYLQWYTLPAAAYFAYLAFSRRKLEHEEYDIFVIGALAFLTVPLAVQAFVMQLPGYGLILLGAAFAIWMAGAMIGYRLIRTWGSVTLVAAFLYQLPYLLNLLTELLSGKLTS